ncbi:hypothetical protein B1H29_34495 [Streptomyces pactum]|uniref:Uncharacterized protein n=1 Tax=Streptomyces pactum TaxID=68249 RepID=A0A1S6JHX1_9ACTN|nr:hypothetical protein B1H29_34495 [Streptomyces pactum]
MSGSAGGPTEDLRTRHHPTEPDGARALEAATTHRDEWLRVHRDTMGFLCLVLRPTGGWVARARSSGDRTGVL